MSAIKDCKHVHYVMACDYEACWPVKFFSTEKAAEEYKDELNKYTHESDWNYLQVVTVEVYD